jgi:DNA-binding helix-hairpin-helix protein with protein kinase domain
VRRRDGSETRRLEKQYHRAAKKYQGIKKDIDGQDAKLAARFSNDIMAATNEFNRRSQDRLVAWRRSQLRDLLTQVTLEDSIIPGIGPKLTRRLTKHGIRTAADVDLPRLQRIPGIGSARMQDLLSWRRRVEAQVSASLPNALPPKEVAELQKQFDRQRNAIQTRHNQQQARINGMRQQSERRAHDEQQKIEAQLNATRATVASRATTLDAVEQEVALYRSVSLVTFLRQIFFLPTG